jgi:hypothetical protein
MLASGLFDFLGVTYGLVIVSILTTVQKEDKEGKKALEDGDRKGFLALCKNKIADVIHELLAFHAILLELVVFLYPYDMPDVGITTVAIVTSMLAMFRRVAIELDDPTRALWFDPPLEWFKPEPKVTLQRLTGQGYRPNAKQLPTTIDPG